MSKNLGHLFSKKGVEGNAFSQMVDASADSGTPDKETLKKIAEEFRVGDSIVYGVASFYDFLKEGNRNKKVNICTGTACLLSGSQKKLKEDLLTCFKEEEIGHAVCLGRCHETSAFQYKNNNYSGTKDIKSIVETGKEQLDSYSVISICQENILTDEISDEKAGEMYRQFVENISQMDCRDKLLKEVKTSGLRGRGGAGFPIGFKIESCKNTPSDQKYIVCNGDEGDPGAYSDRYLLERNPHLVLFGMVLTGYIAGADCGVLYIRAEYPESIQILEKSIKWLQKENFIGKNIGGSDFSFEFKIVKAAGAYICGEETALLASIEGQRPFVKVRPPFPTQSGLFGEPTIVNNVETLASLPYIFLQGGEKFAKIGTKKTSGTKLVSLDSLFNKPALVEVEMGTPLSKVVDEVALGHKIPVKALHIGGPLGGLLPMKAVPDLTIDFESFQENGFLLGHAGVISIPSDFPLTQYIEHLFEFTKDESCGKCFPCRLGAQRGYELFKANNEKGTKIDRQLLDDLLETMEDGSLCALGGGVPLPVKNILEHFEEELQSSLMEKRNRP